MDTLQIPLDERLRITEIYASVQGEGAHAGELCVFLRLTGCNLRCTWCDSEYTFTGGEYFSIDEVVSEACGYGIGLVQVTGGEPLAQRQCIVLMERLVASGLTVLLETSGSLEIPDLPDGVHVIMDLKPPDSGEVESNLWDNLARLRASDEVKFVLASRVDYEWACAVMESHDISSRARVIFSPAWGLLDPADLAEWMLQDKPAARMQLQIHKVIWEPNARGV
jgi:7-carboxy-7-deazaguanine synthase